MLFGSSLLAAALVTKEFWLALAQLCFALAALRLLAGSWLPVLDAWRVLRWVLVPIVLLHVISTPGTLIAPELLGGKGPSYEGVRTAAWLCLRLSLIFATAMIVCRVLGRDEWVRLLLNVPWLGRRVLPYVRLITPMRVSLQRLLRGYLVTWRARCGRRSMTQLGGVCSGLFAQVMGWSRQQGAVLWMRWGVQQETSFDAGMDAAGWSLVSVGGLWLVAACLL